MKAPRGCSFSFFKYLFITDSMDMNLSKLWEIVKDREGSPVCCSPWAHKESGTIWQLNNNNDLFIRLHQVLVAAHRIFFSCATHS